MTRRTERIAGLLQSEIGRLTTGRLKDPRLARLVTLAHVKVSADLAHATVAVTVAGTLDDAREALAGLRSASGYIKRELHQRLNLKRTPELHFVRDTAIEEGDRVLSLLDGIKEQE